MYTHLTFTCSKSTIETKEKGHVYVVNCEHISQFSLVFLLLTFNKLMLDEFTQFSEQTNWPESNYNRFVHG